LFCCFGALCHDPQIKVTGQRKNCKHKHTAIDAARTAAGEARIVLRGVDPHTSRVAKH
jgi:hypothetical protein